MRFHDAGAKLLLNHLKKPSSAVSLSMAEINEIVNQPDISTWVSVYEEWMNGASEEFVTILKSLHEETNIEYSEWGQHIHRGLRDSLPLLEEMMQSLNRLSEYDWIQTASKALQFLPHETILDINVIMTIDGFNGGMYHGNNIFLSLTNLDSSIMEPQYFTHEVHHIGMKYWWERNKVVEKHKHKKESVEAWLLRLFHYMVSEGLANAFCSPRMLRFVEGNDKRAMKHNRIIEEYDSQLDEIFDILESLMQMIIRKTNPKIKAQYEKLVFDMENHFLPKGHYLSGKMVQMMDESPKVTREEIVHLVKEPFEFFHLYNEAASEGNHREIPTALLKSIDRILLLKKSE
jgi:hypothetical protein